MPESKRQFKKILNLTRSLKTYEEISSRIDSILIMNEKDRLENLQKYFLELFGDIYKSGLEFCVNEEFNPTFFGRFADKNSIESKNVMNKVFSAMEQMIREKAPHLNEMPQFFGASALERRDKVISVAKGFPTYELLQRSGREEKISRLNSIANHAQETVRGLSKIKDVKFDVNSTSTYNTEIAELYIRYEVKKAQFEKTMAEKGGWWKFFNFREISKTGKFLKTSEDIFKIVGLNAQEHSARIKERFAGKVFGFIDYQMDMAKKNYTSQKMLEENKRKSEGVEQIKVARDKYKKALKLNEDKKTSIQTKAMPFIEKYGIDLKENGLRFPYSLYAEAGEKFDTMRDTESLESAIKQRFLDIYGHVTRGCLNKNGSIDPKVILDDTQTILDMELKHCTIVYDRPETKKIADNNVYANLSIAILQRRMVQAVKGYYERNGRAFPGEEETNLKNSIEQIVTEARNERRSILEKSEQNVEQNKENQINSPDAANIKQQISIPDLKEETKNIEMSERIPDDQVVSKENISKI